jgi:hypothetical protein
MRNERRGTRVALATALVALLAALPPPASADEHDPKRSGHPLRIAAYVVHPIGVVLDWLVMRPAHWLAHRQPFRTLSGHED